MALLTLVGSAGGRAVPLFLDAGAAVAFRPGARPVPLPGPEACAAALEDGAVAVLVDPPGAALVVTGTELRELAGGRVPVAGAPLSSSRSSHVLTAPAHADAALLRALADALHGEPVRAARLLAGPDGPVLGVVAGEPLAPAALAALAGRVLPRTGVPDLAVAEVPADGPGVPVPLRRRRGGRSDGAGELLPGPLAAGVGLARRLAEGPLQRLQAVAQGRAWIPRSGRAAVTSPASAVMSLRASSRSCSSGPSSASPHFTAAADMRCTAAAAMTSAAGTSAMSRASVGRSDGRSGRGRGRKGHPATLSGRPGSRLPAPSRVEGADVRGSCKRRSPPPT
jgi:hypothetical protein